MTDCTCPLPRESVNPRKQGICNACGRKINPDWTSNDRTVASFYDRLATTIPGWPEVPESFELFRIDCESREFAGRRKFGNSMLVRDNCAEGLEEAADGGNYVFFDTLIATREGEDPEWDIALTAAWHFYKAHEALRELRRRRNGVPG